MWRTRSIYRSSNVPAWCVIDPRCTLNQPTILATRGALPRLLKQQPLNPLPQQPEPLPYRSLGSRQIFTNAYFDKEIFVKWFVIFRTLIKDCLWKSSWRGQRISRRFVKMHIYTAFLIKKDCCLITEILLQLRRIVFQSKSKITRTFVISISVMEGSGKIITSISGAILIAAPLSSYFKILIILFAAIPYVMGNFSFPPSLRLRKSLNCVLKICTNMSNMSSLQIIH